MDDARRAWNAGEVLVFADVRSQSSYNASATTIHGAVRLHPARAVEDARLLSILPETRIIAFCA